MKSLKFHAVACCAAVLLMSQPVQAALVSYSFSSNDTLTGQTGAGVIGGATDQWMTEFIPVDMTARAVDDVALTDVNGNATGATLSHLGLRRHNTAGQVIEAGNPTPLQNSVYMRHNTDPSRMYLFEGLEPGSTADIVLFGTYHRSGIDRGSDFTVDGSTLSTSGNGDRTVFEDGRNYVFFDDVAVGPTGSITVDIAGAGGGGFSDVNGFQIDFTPAIPEPTSLALIGMGLLAYGGVRRR